MATLDPVVIEFALKGFKNVVKAFETLEKTAAKSESNWSRASETHSRARMRSALSEAQHKAAAARKAEKAFEKAERDATRAMEKEASKRKRETEKAARDAVKAEEKRAREMRRIADREERERKQHLRAMVREEEKAAHQRLATERKLGRERERVAKHIYGAGSRGVRNVVRGGMWGARSLMQVGGGFGMADSVQQEANIRGAATALSAQTAGNTGPNKITGGAIMQRAKEVSQASVVGREDVISGMEAFKSKTGNLKSGMDIVGEMAKLSNATGADLTDLMTAAGAVSAGNDKLTPDQIASQMRVYALQGQKGTIEVKDLAKYGSKLVAGAGKFEGSANKNLGSMGAFAQLAASKGGAASAAEAATAAQRFGDDLTKNASKIEAKGVKVRSKSGLLRNPEEILMDLVKKTGGDVTKAAHMGLGLRGGKILSGATKLYNEAGGGKEGEAALRRYLDGMTKGTSLQEINNAEKERLSAEDKKLEKAMNDLKMKVGEELLPAVRDLIPILAKATPVFGELLSQLTKLVSWASDNPFKALSGAIIASITAEIVKANIGATIKSLLTGGGGGGAPGGAGAGGAGLAGPLAAGVAAGAATYGIYKPIADAFGGGVKSGSNQAQDIIAGLGQGTMTAEQAQAQVSGAKKFTGARGAALVASSVLTAGFSAGKSLLTGGPNDSAENIKKVFAAEHLVQSEQVAKAITEAIERGARRANATPHGGGGGNRNAPINSRGGTH